MIDFFQMGKGDQLPSLIIQATTRVDGQTVPLPGLAGGSVVFTMKAEGGSVKINRAGATIVDAANAILRYDWQAIDTDTPGEYDTEFELTIAGKKLTVPNGPRKIKVRVTEDLD